MEQVSDCHRTAPNFQALGCVADLSDPAGVQGVRPGTTFKGSCRVFKIFPLKSGEPSGGIITGREKSGDFKGNENPDHVPCAHPHRGQPCRCLQGLTLPLGLVFLNTLRRKNTHGAVGTATARLGAALPAPQAGRARPRIPLGREERPQELHQGMSQPLQRHLLCSICHFKSGAARLGSAGREGGKWWR